MPQFQMRNTVDRLDRPSSYAMSKYKKRKRNHNDDDAPQPEPEDKLANATTLYVGNLRYKPAHTPSGRARDTD